MTQPIATEIKTGMFTQAVLQNTTAPHNKEYRIALEISETPRVVTQWGRIGYVNRMQVRTFDSVAAATEFAQRLADSQQTDKGYRMTTPWAWPVEIAAPATQTGAVPALAA